MKLKDEVGFVVAMTLCGVFGGACVFCNVVEGMVLCGLFTFMITMIVVASG